MFNFNLSCVPRFCRMCTPSIYNPLSSLPIANNILKPNFLFQNQFLLSSQTYQPRYFSTKRTNSGLVPDPAMVSQLLKEAELFQKKIRKILGSSEIESGFKIDTKSIKMKLNLSKSELAFPSDQNVYCFEREFVDLDMRLTADREIEAIKNKRLFKHNPKAYIIGMLNERGVSPEFRMPEDLVLDYFRANFWCLNILYQQQYFIDYYSWHQEILTGETPLPILSDSDYKEAIQNGNKALGFLKEVDNILKSHSLHSKEKSLESIAYKAIDLNVFIQKLMNTDLKQGQLNKYFDYFDYSELRQIWHLWKQSTKFLENSSIELSENQKNALEAIQKLLEYAQNPTLVTW